MRAVPGLPDWRDPFAYAALLGADRSAIAWEWLRRDAGYRRASAKASATVADRRARDDGGEARRWGLHDFEPADLRAPLARPVWRSERLAQVLVASADHDGELADRFDLEPLAHLATIVRGLSGSEHLLLSDGFRSLRMDVVRGSLLSGAARLRFHLPGLSRIDAPLMALRQFLHLWRTGTFSSRLHPPEKQSVRWIMQLRARDAIAAGASQREIAGQLLSGEAGEPRWRVEAPALRSRAQRLVREARRMAEGGFWMLLGAR